MSSARPELGPRSSNSLSPIAPPERRRADVPEGGRRGSAAYQLGDPEGQVERLAGVQPRVAHRVVSVLEVVTENFLGAAETLGDVLARELDVHTPGPDVSGVAGGEETAQLAHDVLEAPCLVTAVVHESVPVHRVARPHDRMPGHAHRAQKRRKPLLDAVGAHAAVQDETTGLAGPGGGPADRGNRPPRTPRAPPD